jgi:hypothetical protein
MQLFGILLQTRFLNDKMQLTSEHLVNEELLRILECSHLKSIFKKTFKPSQRKRSTGYT